MSGGLSEPIVALSGLDVRFVTRGRTVQAVSALDLSVARGEILAVVGESGSGKSVMLRAMMRLLPRFARIAGSIRVAGLDVDRLGTRALAGFRGKVVSMIYQEPLSALDPMFTIGTQIAEAVEAHEGVSRRAARARALEMLERVQIPSARARLDAYPHQLSGGMRQRAMIALALACGPQLLLADEPTTALDTTVQMQILLQLRQLQRALGMTVMFVTHDLAVAVEIADRIVVMYAGRVVEIGPMRDIVTRPRHPYTAALFAATVHGGMRGRPLDAIPGAPPVLAAPEARCSFLPRCSRATAACATALPPLDPADASHRWRCFHPLDAPPVRTAPASIPAPG